MDTLNLPTKPGWFARLFTALFAKRHNDHEHCCLARIGEDCDC